MLRSIIQKQLPERLSHYTRIEELKSILSDKEGKGICFWAFSNRCKNDDQEIRMGEYMLKRVREVLPPSSTILNQFGGYEDSGSISFMEGETLHATLTDGSTKTVGYYDAICQDEPTTSCHKALNARILLRARGH